MRNSFQDIPEFEFRTPGGPRTQGDKLELSSGRLGRLSSRPSEWIGTFEVLVSQMRITWQVDW